MSQSDYYSQNSDGLKDKVSNAADAVQQASVDAYEIGQRHCSGAALHLWDVSRRTRGVCAWCTLEA